jgi:hypothetical protein
MNEEIRDAVKLTSQTVFMPIGKRETLLPLAYKLREPDLHLIAPDSWHVPLVVEIQWVELNALEERQMGDVTYWVGPRQFVDR